jgi:hypothetical protein
MDVPNHSVLIQNEADRREITARTFQPPPLQRLPVAVECEWKSKLKACGRTLQAIHMPIAGRLRVKDADNFEPS